MATRWGVYEIDRGACGIFEHFTESWLVLDVLSWLELEDIFRVRLVCKSWYDAVFSPHFIRLFMERHHDPWLVLRIRTEQPACRHGNGFSFLFGPETHDDYFDCSMKLASHTEVWRPYTQNPRKKCSLPLGPPGSPFLVLCASNGLVCGRLMDERRSLVLAVGNPFTNKWKKLPPAPVSFESIPATDYLPIFMETESETGYYRVVVSYIHDEVDVYVFQYESEAGVWEAGTTFNSETTRSASPLERSFVYTREDGVAGYDPVSREWWLADVGSPMYEGWETFFLGAFMYKGKCLTVTPLKETEAALWELDAERKCWSQLSKVAWKDLFGQEWRMVFHGLTPRRIDVVGDTLIISSLFRNESFGNWPPVAYDMVKSHWYTCVRPEEFGDHFKTGAPCLPFDMECCYALVPSLTAQP